VGVGTIRNALFPQYRQLHEHVDGIALIIAFPLLATWLPGRM